MLSLLTLSLIFITNQSFADSIEMTNKRSFEDLATCLRIIDKETSYRKFTPSSDFASAGSVDTNSGFQGMFAGVGGRHEKINDFILNGDGQNKTFVRFASVVKSDLRTPTQEQIQKRNIKMEVCKFIQPERGLFKVSGLLKQKTFKFLDKQSAELNVQSGGRIQVSPINGASQESAAAKVNCTKVSADEEQTTFASLESKMKTDVLNKLRGLDPVALGEIYKGPSSKIRSVNEVFQRGLLAREHSCAKVIDPEIQQEIALAGDRIIQACKRTGDARRNCPTDSRLKSGRPATPGASSAATQ